MNTVVQDVLEEAEAEVQDALDNPEDFNFREGGTEKVPVEPDSSFIRSSVVNLGNGNVEIIYDTHSSEEKYVAVLNDENFSMIESNYVVRINDTVERSKIYHLITEDSTFIYDRGDGWTEEFNPGLREVAEAAGKLYQKALEEETEELDWGEKDYVPTPEDEDISRSGFPL